MGFKEIYPTHSGRNAAIKLYNQYPEFERPMHLESINEIVKKVVKVAVQLEAPIEIEPRITAIK